MAQQFYDLDLRNISFPMLSEQQGRTIIGSTAGEAPAATSKPGIAYCHNVMPTEHGLDAIGYISQIPVFVTALPFSDVRVAFGDLLSRLYLAWDTEGNVFALLTGSSAWIAVPATAPATGGPGFDVGSVTIGTVNGVSYIFYSGIGAFTYNEGTNELDAVTLVGLTIGDILGVVATSGYLVAYTTTDIAWSSTIDPTDFTPSQISGAGGGSVANLAGAIIFATNNSLGMLIYTAANVVAGTYTGNAGFPFKIREVVDSKGGINLDRVAYEANSGAQFVYSKAGLQSITSHKTENILPDVTDFLAGRRFEDYNEITRLYEITDLADDDTMLKKLKYIASRYLVVSYGLPGGNFTHALVFDTAFKRLGKLKIDHVDVFEYIGEQSEISKESIAFLLPTGEVRTVDFSVTSDASGVLILGKLQFIRTRLLSLEGVEIENVGLTDTLDVYSQVSLDGKTFTTVQGTSDLTVDNLRTYHFHAVGKNHSLVLIGKFGTVTAQVRYVVKGRR